jgi:heterodisulfide reductase subunit D
MGFLRKIFGNTLYYPGCMMKFVTKQQNENYKKILKVLKIDFIQLSEIELCCGSPVLKAGYEEDYENLARKNFEIFKKHSVKEIISPCPACVHTISGYKKIIKDFDMEVKNAMEVIYEKINKLKKKKEKEEEKEKKREKVTFHDPCHLGRYQGIYDLPRKILENLGYEVVEMYHSKNFSLCCGAGGGFRANFEELSRKIAEKRISEAKEVSNILVTSCPLCYYQLKEAGDKKGIKVYEISDLLMGFL